MNEAVARARAARHAARERFTAWVAGPGLPGFAVFDNPATMCREAWHLGRLVAGVGFEFLFLREPPPLDANLTRHPWKTGFVDGDILALPIALQKLAAAP